MNNQPNDSLHFAEYVSPGHPDRLADAIAEKIVRLGMEAGDRSLVGVEVATHEEQVFIDGRFAVPRNPGQDKPGTRQMEAIRECIGNCAREAFREAGYGESWSPAPANLRITNVACIETLQEGEDEIRTISDDQNIVIGYADPSAGTNHLPAAHFLANRIGRAVLRWRSGHSGTYGPDFKVLPQLRRVNGKNGDSWEWERLTLSLQHKPGTFYEQQHNDLLPFLHETLEELEASTGLRGTGSTFEPAKLHLNGAGDFCQGGPEGDNGLSGKKLVVDHYGPDVPIGGGALCGKDPHKVDRAGALRARQLARQLAVTHGLPARARLGWSPGEAEPFLVEAALLDKNSWQAVPRKKLPPGDWFAIETIFRALDLRSQDWSRIILNGFFTDPGHPWEN